MESFPLEVPTWNSCFVVYNENYVGLQVLEHKKNPCWTDDALKGGFQAQYVQHIQGGCYQPNLTFYNQSFQRAKLTSKKQQWYLSCYPVLFNFISSLDLHV
ncbi:hypothetical protein CFP56_040364 [Quercus suber]|uniref:Uncharacterized protein n=1 Tax=Quercus suber TaxID=58331 RepID=A0AAW0LM72_QUESU